MELRLRDYIKLSENWAAENYSGPSANMPQLRNNWCWKFCNGPCGYLNHGITKDAFIALQTPVRGAQILWLACLCIFLSVTPPGYLRNDTMICTNFCGCCLWQWIGPPPAEWRNPKWKGNFGGFLPFWQYIVQNSIWDPYKNGWNDRDVVWDDEWAWPEEQC